MWYAFDIDDCLAIAKTKKEVINIISDDEKYRIKRIGKSVYEYEYLNEDENRYIANKYIYGSKELAVKHGFSEQIEEFLKNNE